MLSDDDVDLLVPDMDPEAVRSAVNPIDDLIDEKQAGAHLHRVDVVRARIAACLTDGDNLVISHASPPSAHAAEMIAGQAAVSGSEERRVGEECVSTCRARW